MTFDSFVTKYDGKYVDFDGKYGCQCVDLMRQFCQDALGLPGYTLPAAPYAKDIYNNFNQSQYFTKIANTPTGVPKKGDIIFWGFYFGVTGWAGHVGIFLEGDVNSFISFDQNYPTGTSCHRQKHSYKGVMGWLRQV